VLVVEQNIPQLLRIVDRVYVIRSGRVILEETVDQMRERDQYWDLF
jgi:branched-chain amino acid transport system ATP-binding protein